MYTLYNAVSTSPSWCLYHAHIGYEQLKDDVQRFFTKLMQKSFLIAYCNINPSV